MVILNRVKKGKVSLSTWHLSRDLIDVRREGEECFGQRRQHPLRPWGRMMQ